MIGTIVHMKWENAQRDHGKRDHRLDGLAPIEESQLGHRHPKFRYFILFYFYFLFLNLCFISVVPRAYGGSKTN
jgi:hypothetical protein